MNKLRLNENVSPLVFGAIILSPIVWLLFNILTWGLLWNWWGFFAILALCVILAFLIGINRESETEQKQRFHIEIEKKKKENAHMFDEKYGTCTKSVILDGNDFYYIRVYEEAQVLVAWTGMRESQYQYVVCNFNSIIGCEYNGETLIPQTSISANNASIVGRAAIGAVIAGPVGAIIGGVSTPNKVETTVHSTGNDVLIYTNNISTPLIHIPFGFRSSQANEVFATVKAIISKYVDRVPQGQVGDN